MKVLVLGNSDTEGLAPGQPTWTRIAAQALGDAIGQPVDVQEVRFAVSTSTAAEFGARKVREAAPDLVIMPVGTFQFTVGFVWLRVRQLLGNRAGEWYRRLEVRLDSGTRGKGPIRDLLNRGGRKFARTVIGTRPICTSAELADYYTDALRALSQVEDIHVALVQYPGRSRFTQAGKVKRERDVFLAAVKAVAEDRRFLWIDSAQAFVEAVGDAHTSSRDGYHMNELGHRVLGQHVAARVAASGVLPG
ncbi:MAG: GDSL-type esterase/lipase family protein [Dehalococcoidia bacterium]